MWNIRYLLIRQRRIFWGELIMHSSVHCMHQVVLHKSLEVHNFIAEMLVDP
jgi:hypothetical protein